MLQGLFIRAEQLSHRSEMPCQIDREGHANFVGQSEPFKHEKHIEQIAGMLTIQRGAEFATIQIGNRQNPAFHELLEFRLGDIAKRSRFRRE